jgi:hypothetical protein
MPYKTNVVGRDDESGYDLSYGKGGAKLTVFAAKQPNGKFLCPELSVTNPIMLREIKAVALAWFEANYQAEPGEDATTPAPKPAATPVAAAAPHHGYVKGERDPVCEGERRFFETLSTLTRRLTDKEARELRDITNYLTGIHQPVKIEEFPDAGDTDGVRGDAGGSGEDAAADVQGAAPVKSGPPSYRPSSPAGGPPPYRKPVG